MRASPREPLLDSRAAMMHATYWKDDDILEVRFSDKPIAREV